LPKAKEDWDSASTNAAIADTLIQDKLL
jgi:hypothetical protein